MQKIELTSKLVLALIAATVVVFSAMTVPSVVAQTTSSPPIRDNSVTSAKIKDGEVKTADLDNGAVTSQKIASGTLDLKMHFVKDNIILQIGEQRGLTVDCPSGEQVTGGGYTGAPDMSIYINAPHEAATGIAVGWDVAARNDGNQALALFAYVMCAQPFP